MRATARIIGTASTELSQEAYEVYVIETTTDTFRIPSGGVAALKWIFWYAPALGAAVKMRTEWTQGPMIGGAAESELWKIDLPAG